MNKFYAVEIKLKCGVIHWGNKSNLGWVHGFDSYSPIPPQNKRLTEKQAKNGKNAFNKWHKCYREEVESINVVEFTFSKKIKG